MFFENDAVIANIVTSFLVSGKKIHGICDNHLEKLLSFRVYVSTSNIQVLKSLQYPKEEIPSFQK
jgi:hypothetical protein